MGVQIYPPKYLHDVIDVLNSLGEAVPEDECVKITLRDISSASIAAEEMGGASEAATPSMSRQSSTPSMSRQSSISTISSSTNDTPIHSHTISLPALETTPFPLENSHHVAMDNIVVAMDNYSNLNGSVPSGATPVHEMKQSVAMVTASGPMTDDLLLLEREREKLCAALDEKVICLLSVFP